MKYVVTLINRRVTIAVRTLADDLSNLLSLSVFGLWLASEDEWTLWFGVGVGNILDVDGASEMIEASDAKTFPSLDAEAVLTFRSETARAEWSLSERVSSASSDRCWLLMLIVTTGAKVLLNVTFDVFLDR